MTDESKAITEVAKLGQEITKATVAMGAYLAAIVGDIPHDVLGIAGGDWLHQKRQTNLALMEAKTARDLEHIARERIREPSPSIVLPLLRLAADESRDSLQDLWAALLANTMIDDGTRVRRAFIEVLAQLEPSDAFFLDRMFKLSTSPGFDRQNLLGLLQAERLQIDDLVISANTLNRLGLIDWERCLMTSFGRMFLRACEVGGD